MATNRYVCRHCAAVHEFDSRRKRIICPYCDRDISWNSLIAPTVVSGTLYTGLSCIIGEKLVIPEGAKYIEWKANGTFSYSTMSEIVFPSTLLSIPSSCFSHCRSLKKLVIPGNVKQIGPSAFSNCENLEEVVLSEGVEEIGAFAFFECKNLKRVTLPSTLKKIGGDAFTVLSYHSSPLRMVALPENVTDIGDDAFEWESVRLSAKAGSTTERCLKKMEKKYSVRNSAAGFALSAEVWKGKLYFWSHPQQTDIRIPKDVTSIAGYAFADCPSIERVSFPDSVKEIAPYAFFGCKGITTLSFGSGLEKIGGKAFSGVANVLIELPSSIKEIAPDAFGKGCVLSVDGDMPFYALRRQNLDVMAQAIAAKKEAITEAQSLKLTAEVELEAYVKTEPAAFKDIPPLQAQVDAITAQQASHAKQAKEAKTACDQLVHRCEVIISDLTEQHKKCFFLAVSKKKELAAQIEGKQSEYARLISERHALHTKTTAEQARFSDELRPLLARLNELTDAQKRWVAKKKSLTDHIAGLEADIQKRQSELKKMQAQLDQETKALETERKRWQKAKEALLQKQAILALQREKEEILAKLHAPAPTEAAPYKYTPRKAVVEESLLNLAFLENLAAWTEHANATQHNQFIAKHAAKLKRVREINALLGLDAESGIEQYQPMETRAVSNRLPERFTTFHAFFAKTPEWALFKQALEPFTSAKCPKTNLFDQFFAKADGINLLVNNAQLLLFPHCLVKCVSGKPMEVYTYEQTVLTLSHTEETGEFDVLPPHAELISERHMHLNQDGSVSRRYKHNPIIKTVRYSTATISCGKEDIKLLFDSHAEATAFQEAFSAYQQFLTSGNYRRIYNVVNHSEDMDAFDAAVAKHREEELRRAEEEEKCAEEARIAAEEAERQREAERIAAQKAAEEMRLAIIQRQREANEERKRQEAQRQRVLSLFEEEPEEQPDAQTDHRTDADAYIEVVGNRTISNNVFKVSYRQLLPFSAENALCYFVAADGSLISNKRKLPNGEIGTEATVGFVLASGIDYTQMKSCVLRVEINDGVVNEIDFKMNISFYSDF